jgi:HAD superfamily hydrolase (TIGR01490 family)
MALAFFDLDRTLISVNSGALWVQSELRLGFVTRWQATRAAAWIFGYHLGFSKMEPILEEAVRTLAGSAETDVRDRTLAFYRAEVAHTYRPGARDAVARHRAAGDTLVMLTSSSPYLSEPVRQELGFDHVLCNRFEVVDGVFTGRSNGPLCFGPGKLGYAERLCAELGATMAEAAFYTDSASDRPVLEAVGVPVCVNADPALRRLARKRGWRSEDWGSGEALRTT